MTTQLRDQRPEAASVPRMRFWGDRQPPKNRAEMFSTTVTAAAADDASTADGAEQVGAVATLRLYGPIDSWGGWWGISARDVSAALDSLGEDVTEIRVRINSPGGEAWEGLAILNMLRAHRAKVVSVVDGIAASAASYIACGVEETVMSPGTQLMIHDASSFAFGPAAAMRKTATVLDSVSDAIASLYAEAAGGTDAAWRALMVEETWYTAAEAVTAGLADRVGVVADAGSTATAGDESDQGDGGDFEDRFDLSLYNYAGRSHAPAPKQPAASAAGSTSPAAAALRDTSQEGTAAMNEEQLTALRQKLGVSPDADADTVLTALDEALAERAESTPPGAVVVDEATLAQMREDATAGRTALTNQQARDREATVTAAINDGRIPPARRGHWVAQLAADPEGAGEVLAKLEKGTIPVTELGNGDGADEPVNGSQKLLDSLYPNTPQEG